MKCEHRDSTLVKVLRSKDNRKRYFFECNVCDAEWMEWGCKPKDTSDITDKDMEVFM